MFKNIIHLLFPPKCIFCGDILSIGTEIEICELCLKKIPLLDDNLIKPGQKPFKDSYCDEVVCLCQYSGMIRQVLVRYKFYNKASCYRTLGKMLSDKVKRMTDHRKFDIIISVPLYKAKERARGYNQSRLISMVIGRQTGIAEGSGLLVKTRDTGKQSLLNRNERSLNIRGAFRVIDEDKIKGKTILLVDDILTTGHTVNECSRVLKEAGAEWVTAAVIASGKRELWGK